MSTIFLVNFWINMREIFNIDFFGWLLPFLHDLARCILNHLSLVFFFNFEDEKVVLAQDDVIGEGNLKMYRPFVCLDYLKFRENNEKENFDKIGYSANDFAGLKCQIQGYQVTKFKYCKLWELLLL